MNELEALQAQCKELEYALEREIEEKQKLGVMYEELLKEKTTLEKRIEFLSGANSAYSHCISNIGGRR